MSSDATISCLSPTCDIPPGHRVRATTARLEIDGTVVRARPSGRLLIKFGPGLYLEVSRSCVERLEVSEGNERGEACRTKQDALELLTV
jgi:hypothetical protein